MHTIKTDPKQRLRLPAARPGQVFAYEERKGQIVLTPVVKQTVAMKARLIRKKGQLPTFKTPPGFALTDSQVKAIADDIFE